MIFLCVFMLFFRLIFSDLFVMFLKCLFCFNVYIVLLFNCLSFCFVVFLL
jgi:hypothetical protein